MEKRSNFTGRNFSHRTNEFITILRNGESTGNSRSIETIISLIFLEKIKLV